MKKLLAMLLALAFALGVPALAAGEGEGPVVHTALLHSGAASGIAPAPEGGYLVTDTFNKVVWQVLPGGEPVQLVGRVAVIDQAGEPVGGYNDADYASSAFGLPWDITPFLEGYLVSDSLNNVVRYFADDRVQTAFGSGTAGYREGRGMAALLSYPTGLATDDRGNAYVCDTDNHVIRKMTPDGAMTTLAGTGRAGYADGTAGQAAFNRPTGLCWHDGALYVADTDNHVIRKIQDGQVSTVAGTAYTADDGDSAQGGDYADGPALEARFASPTGVAVDSHGAVYISDSAGSAVRVLAGGLVSTLLKADADRGDPYPVAPRGLLVDGDTLLIADPFSGVVFTPIDVAIATFGDVPADAWYAQAVYDGVRRGLFQGTGDGVFGPTVTLSRGMLVTVLGRLAGLTPESPSPTPFGDVDPDAYYAPYIAWAQAADLVTGRGLLLSGDEPVPYFAPESPITRQEIVTLLYRYAAYTDRLDAGRDDLSAFADAGQAADWALEAWQWAVASGVVSGYEDDTLHPGGTATRAEMAQMVYSFVRHLNP